MVRSAPRLSHDDDEYNGPGRMEIRAGNESVNLVFLVADVTIRWPMDIAAAEEMWRAIGGAIAAARNGGRPLC